LDEAPETIGERARVVRHARSPVSLYFTVEEAP
jgi:hypothetical protein